MIWKVCILSSCLFNIYKEYIVRNAGLDESQAGIKIARRNIIILRCADDTTWMIESEEEQKEPLDEGEKESAKGDLKLNIQNTNIMASGPITSQQIEGEKVKTVKGFILLGSKITVVGDCSHEIKKILAPWKESYDKPTQSIKKQRHHFDDKDLYSQSYEFSIWKVGP